jgi:SWI/SNF-related matrix-associated actin-dependent regulator of chromatin subfamily A-like protein 1
MNHLFDYQKTGAEFLANNPAAFLADEQGLGKTIQVIAACDMLGLRKVVVICPAIAKINWKREFEKWGSTEREVKVFSYDKMTQSKEVRNEIAKFEPDVLVIDEAHYLKNRQAKRTKYLYGQFCHGDGLVRFADRVWLLSGTPIPNNVSDFWTHLKAIWQYPLNFTDFTLYFCLTWNTKFGLKIGGNKTHRMSEFKSVLSSIMLRRKTENVLKELPPLWWQDSIVEVEGWDDMAHIENDKEREAVELILQNAVTQGDISGKLGEIAPHMASLRRLTALAKAKPIAAQLAGELSDHAYDKVIVFAYHKAALEALREGLAEFNPAFIVGGMGNNERQGEIDRFQGDPTCRVFIGQITACSTAITLTAANQVVFAEMDWVPAVNAQASKRCHRIGQSKPVIVRSFALANSTDEVVARTLAKKAQMISEALD